MTGKVKIYFPDSEMAQEFQTLDRKLQTDEFLRFIDFKFYFKPVKSIGEADIIVSALSPSISSVSELLINYNPPSANHFVIIYDSKYYEWENKGSLKHINRGYEISRSISWDITKETSKALGDLGFKICYNWRHVSQRLVNFLKEKGKISFAFDAPSLMDKRRNFKKQKIYFSPFLPALKEAFINAEEKDMWFFCRDWEKHYVYLQLRKYFNVVDDPKDAAVKVWSERDEISQECKKDWKEFIVMQTPPKYETFSGNRYIIKPDTSKWLQELVYGLYCFLEMNKDFVHSNFDYRYYLWKNLYN